MAQKGLFINQQRVSGLEFSEDTKEALDQIDSDVEIFDFKGYESLEEAGFLDDKDKEK